MVTEMECWKMWFVSVKATQFHGLPKVNRKGIPLRAFATFPGTAMYGLAEELWRRLKPLINGSNHSVNNAHQLLGKLRDVTQEEDQVMISYDATALFTLIDLDLLKKINKEPSQGHCPDKLLGTRTIYELLKMCPDTCFILDGDVDK